MFILIKFTILDEIKIVTNMHEMENLLLPITFAMNILET